jgi:glycosyltransferase involved in cell wall biosynthesis
MLVTVALCTWNRAGILDRTLGQLRELRIPTGYDWELLVVNNNCTDDTDAVIARHAAHLPVRRLFEPSQGSSHGRNCAIREAKGDLICFTDDDVLVDREWVAEYVRAAQAWPQAAFFGGRIDPWFVEPPPSSIQKYIAAVGNAFALTDMGEGVRPLGPHENPCGANMALRTGPARQHPFDPRLGRVKRGLIGDEETNVFERMRGAGYIGVWVGSSRVRHYIPPERANWRFIWDFNYAIGRSATRWKGIGQCATLAGMPRWMIAQYIRLRLASAVGRLLGRPNWVKSYTRAAYFLGSLAECSAYRRAHAGDITATPSNYLVAPLVGNPAELV